MVLNLGFSSGRRLARPIFLLKVHASQSRTSLGTDSACRSLSSSSVSSRRLRSKCHTAVTACWSRTGAGPQETCTELPTMGDVYKWKLLPVTQTFRSKTSFSLLLPYFRPSHLVSSV